ncbi:MAG: hypothetical protein CXZ00_10310 [Acidobacteria bacterium]|nr:MAG: hypothetical protein CXZ00_10310 [Acidobacteriota bacterium]
MVWAACACSLGLLLLITSCGQTYSLQTVSISALPTGQTTEQVGTVILNGMGVTANIIVRANYTNTKSEVVTALATFDVVPVGNGIASYAAGHLTLDDGLPNPVLSPINNHGDLQYNASGLITAVDPGVCTAITDSSKAISLTGYYKVTATYKGVTSQPLYVALASAVPAGDGTVKGGCPFDLTPSTT